MADLSNPLTQISVAQAQPAVTANNLIDAMSPAALYGQNDLTTTGLTFGYYGGRFRGISVAHGAILLPANQASVYIVAAIATGVVSQSTSNTNWNNATDYMRLYLATTGATTITDWDDYREWLSSAAAGVAVVDTETIQDVVGALIVAGSNVTVTYDDAGSPASITIASTGGATWGSISGTLSSQSDLQNALNAKVAQGTFEEQVQDIVAALISAGANVTKQYNDGDSPPTLVISATGGGGGSSLTQEQVEDICASLITAGTNVTKQYNDGDSPATLVISASGGALTNFTEALNTSTPNATIPVASLSATNAATSVDFAIVPKANGAILADIADNTATGGNKRGTNAVDLQLSRTNADEVASASYSSIVGGQNNKASQTYAAIMGGTSNLASGSRSGVFCGLTNIASGTDAACIAGTTNTASATYTVCIGGGSNTASADYGVTMGQGNVVDGTHSFVGGKDGQSHGVKRSFCWSGAQVFNNGTHQSRLFVLSGRTLDATPLIITTDSAAAAANNQVNAISSGLTSVTGQVTARRSTGADLSVWNVQAAIKNIGGTTSLLGTPTVTQWAEEGTGDTWVLAITASNANDCLVFTVTGEASKDIYWTAVLQSCESGN